LHIGTGDSLAGDLLIYNKQKLTPSMKNKRIISGCSPEIAAEIGTKADYQSYLSKIFIKTNK